MTCSKLFSGDLPEVSTCIIQNLRNDVSTLYHLALVNRFWCRLAILLLWKDPFSIKYKENSTSHFLNTYFLFLSDNDKNIVKELKFYEIDSNLQKPLFNYPGLMKTLNFFRLHLHVTNWINSNLNNNNNITSTSSVQQSSLTCLQNEPVEVVYNSDDEQMEVICTVLFNVFIESGASLNNLLISIDNHFPVHFYDDICNTIILNYPKFISEIEMFSLEYYCYSLVLQTFLSTLPSLSTSIKHIYFSSNNRKLEKSFANIIQSQSQLTSIKFNFAITHFKVPLLNSLKSSSNTLISVDFYLCHFSDSMIFDALSHLTQLESLQFRCCNGFNSNVIQPLLNITTPLKIKTFVITENFIEDFTPIPSLIQKIGSYIEYLVLCVCEDELRVKLFDIIMDFCKKIKFLHLGYIDAMNIPQLSKIIFNFNHCLKYLTLETKFHNYNYFYDDTNNTRDNEDDLKMSSMILKELSKSLPISLHYLDLNLTINPDDLRITFENYNQVKLKKLLIRNRSKNNIDTTLKIIKDFIKTRARELEFLAYYIGYHSLSDDNDLCHKSLEKLIEETQSFIKMVKYEDLVIRVSEIDGNFIFND